MSNLGDQPLNLPLGSGGMKPTVGGVALVKTGSFANQAFTASYVEFFDDHNVVLAEASVIFGLAVVVVYAGGTPTNQGSIRVTANAAAISPEIPLAVFDAQGTMIPVTIPFQASLTAGSKNLNIEAKETSGGFSIDNTGKVGGHSIGYVIFKS